MRTHRQTDAHTDRQTDRHTPMITIPCGLRRAGNEVVRFIPIRAEIIYLIAAVKESIKTVTETKDIAKSLVTLILFNCFVVCMVICNSPSIYTYLDLHFCFQYLKRTVVT